MDVAPEIREFNLQVQAAVQKVYKSVQEMPRLLVATINQRVLTVDGFHPLLVWLERCYVGVILPEAGAGGADIGQEIARIGSVQVAHGGRQHDDVAGGLVIIQDEFAHPASPRICQMAHFGRGYPLESSG